VHGGFFLEKKPPPMPALVSTSEVKILWEAPMVFGWHSKNGGDEEGWEIVS
jgi:hypothetical protein